MLALIIERSAIYDCVSAINTVAGKRPHMKYWHAAQNLSGITTCPVEVNIHLATTPL